MSRFLTTADVASRWSCSAGYVRKLARSGRLVGMRLGSDWRFSLDAVEAYEQRHTSEPAVTVTPACHTHTIGAGGVALPADYVPAFPELWAGHAPQNNDKRRSAVTKRR